MKIWELEKDNEYMCEGNKYLYDKDGCLHIKKNLKRNGCKSWFLFNPSYYTAREMEFELIKKESQCNHRDKNGRFTIAYDDIYEMRSSDMHCTQCYESGSRKELQLQNRLIN